MVSHDATHGSLAFAALLTVGGAAAAFRGARLLARALGSADDPSASLWLIRGIRGIVVAVAAASLAGGLLFEQTWLLVFGTVFLAEELYETGVVALLLRSDCRRGGSESEGEAGHREKSGAARGAGELGADADVPHDRRSELIA